MKPVIPRRSELQPGDWLVVPNEDSVHRQSFRPAPAMGEPVHVIARRRAFPLRTIPAYYGGHLPLERGPDPQVEVKIHRISEKWAPESN